MNKSIKYILIALNIISLFFAICWTLEDGKWEAGILILSQICTLLMLCFEGLISNNNVEKIRGNSKIKVKNKSTSYNRIKDIDNSEVDVSNE